MSSREKIMLALIAIPTFAIIGIALFGAVGYAINTIVEMGGG